jgi:hypothetical protein
MGGVFSTQEININIVSEEGEGKKTTRDQDTPREKRIKMDLGVTGLQMLAVLNWFMIGLSGALL